jgi:hypothetical protein
MRGRAFALDKAVIAFRFLDGRVSSWVRDRSRNAVLSFARAFMLAPPAVQGFLRAKAITCAALKQRKQRHHHLFEETYEGNAATAFYLPSVNAGRPRFLAAPPCRS